MNRQAFDVTTRFGFLQDGCAALARNARNLLRLAGEPLTPAAIMKIAKAMPRDVSEFADERWKRGEMNGLLQKAFERSKGGQDARIFREISDYFIRYIPSRSYSVLDDLESAFRGVLGNFPEELETGIDLLPDDPPRIEFQCGDCGHAFSVDPQYAGKKGKCKNCGSVTTIPEVP
jgi:hypothetical protein